MVVAVLILSVLFVACQTDTPHTVLPQIHLGIAYDVTGSVEQRGLPFFTIQHLDRLNATLKNRGGSMAFGLIDERAFVPLVRLTLQPVTGLLNERAAKNTENKSSTSEFRSKVESKIARKRDAPATDVNGSLMRFQLFFNEPKVQSNAEKIFFVVSDGEDTGPWRLLKGVKLPSDVRIYVVGMRADIARDLFGAQALLFEGIDAAIKAISANQT
jgi:hypothetical protein